MSFATGADEHSFTVTPASSSPHPSEMRPPFDARGVASAEDLRRRLLEDRRAGRAAWIELRGLSIGRADMHGALLHALTAFRLGADHGRTVPSTAVLDWTNVDGTSAEALAMFAVLVRTLVSQGISVVICEPEDGDIGAALEASAIRAACGSVTWIPRVSRQLRRVEVLAPSAQFGGALGRAPLRPFLAAVVEALQQLGVHDDRVALVADALMEILLNVITHAEAEHAAGVLVLHRRRRPRVVEVGVADSGMGIATNILMQPRHAWLAPSDRGVTEAVFAQALSGRDATEGGGGMTRIVRRLVDTCGATVIVRSGAAKITLTGSGAGGLSVVGHTFGWGTQTQVVIPLET